MLVALPNTWVLLKNTREEYSNVTAKYQVNVVLFLSQALQNFTRNLV